MSADQSKHNEPSTRGDSGGPPESLGLSGHGALTEAHAELERHSLDKDGAAESVLKYRDAVLDRYFPNRPIFTLAWPHSLYIPADADSNQYWISPAPADHRYRYRWTDPQPTNSTASEKTGRLFSWTNVSALNPSYTGVAGVGARIVPTASLSTLRISADIDVLTESRWWYLVGSSAGYASFSFRGSAYITAWEINSVTRSWELQRPFASRALFNYRTSGQGGNAVRSDHHAFDDLSVKVQLQGGHEYAIGVSFETEITYDCHDRNGKPYTKQPGDDIKLWASMVGQVASISVSTETVWIP